MTLDRWERMSADHPVSPDGYRRGRVDHRRGHVTLRPRPGSVLNVDLDLSKGTFVRGHKRCRSQTG